MAAVTLKRVVLPLLAEVVEWSRPDHISILCEQRPKNGKAERLFKMLDNIAHHDDVVTRYLVNGLGHIDDPHVVVDLVEEATRSDAHRSR